MSCTTKKTKNCGGLKFEIRLAEPASSRMNTPKLSAMSRKKAMADNIKQKLKAAEERRLNLEQKKIAELNVQRNKEEAASRKRCSMDEAFSKQTKANLDSKMEKHTEKRNAIIGDVRERQKKHLKAIEKARQQMDEQKCVGKIAIDNKLKKAQGLREATEKKTLERIKKHNTRITELREIDADEVLKSEQKERINNKLHAAECKRLKGLQNKVNNTNKSKSAASGDN